MSFLTAPDGARLRYTDHGRGPDTVVLVHGWKGSHRLWDPIAYRLARSLRVIAFDNRGMGESDKPTARYDFGLLAADLGFVVEKLDAKDVTLVGWSMGCSISLEYLRLEGARVSKLVLVNGPVKLTRTQDFPWTMTMEQVDGYLDDLARGWPDAERAFVAKSLRHADSEFAAFYYQVALQTPLEAALRIVREQIMLDHIDVVRTLKVPVLAIYGRHDPFYPIELGEWIAATAPDGRCEVFEHSAHALHYDEPDRFVEVITEFARGRYERS